MSEFSPLQILLIEDDQDTLANLRDILELDDHRVCSASSVTEALKRTDLATVSVVICDRRLPDGNAENLLPQLKLAMPAADIIIVTGHVDVESAIRALQRGAADYIIKPINPELLRVSLRRTAKHTELRVAKERSDANFRGLIEAVDFMVIILCQHHKITFANRFAAELAGYSPDELVGRPISSLIAHDSHASVEHQLRRLHLGQRAPEQEIPIRRRDGDEKWILWNVRLLKDLEGSPAMLAVGHDVTERRRLEQRALQSERLAAIGQMVTGLAHESRNALQRSQASLELLKDELRGQTEPLELVEQIERAQRHLHHLYEEVRSYAGPVVLHRERKLIDQVWQAAWANLEEAVRVGKRLTLKEARDTPNLAVQIDPVALEQVFRNILENAIRVSREGDWILIAARDSFLRGHPALEIRIRDQGPGLSPEQAARIFEPFYTTQTQGTGLGMAIAKRIVEAHGGQLSVGRQTGPGAEIVVTLPHGTI